MVIREFLTAAARSLQRHKFNPQPGAMLLQLRCRAHPWLGFNPRLRNSHMSQVWPFKKKRKKKKVSWKPPLSYFLPLIKIFPDLLTTYLAHVLPHALSESTMAFPSQSAGWSLISLPELTNQLAEGVSHHYISQEILP